MKKKPRTDDICGIKGCEAPVWQYDEQGKPYCAAHGRWRALTIERMKLPTDDHHAPHVHVLAVQKAARIIQDIIERIGPAEAFWVAEHLGMEWGVQWWNDQIYIRLSDLQLVAFAGAIRAHHETIYPRRPAMPVKKDEPTKSGGNLGKKKKRRL